MSSQKEEREKRGRGWGEGGTGKNEVKGKRGMENRRTASGGREREER